MLQAIPLIKECLRREWGVSVYPEADSESGTHVFDAWGQIKVVRGAASNYDLMLSSPYNKGALSISGKKIRWKDAMYEGEATLYCRLLDRDFPEHDITAPLWSGREFPELEGYTALWPGCKNDWPVKRWPYFRKLATKFKKVVVLGRSDGMYMESVPEHCVNLIDKLDYLPDVAALIRKCKRYIGNDGGISHLAATTGTPTNILFGMASVRKNRPRGDHVNIIAKDLECVPCQGVYGSSHRKCYKYDKPRCMHDLSWQEVIERMQPPPETPCIYPLSS